MNKKQKISSGIREKIIFSIMLFLFAILNGFSQQQKLNPKIKNESKLNPQSTKATNKITDVDGATYCSGEIDDVSIKEINKIGITASKLEELVQCTIGDFDGNGYLDFVIWGIDKTKKIKNNVQWSDGENYVVLFFEKSKIIKIKKIKTTPGFYLVHYLPRSKKGVNGEPITKNDALWIWGETGGYDDYSKGKVYIYDSKSENFKMTEFGKK